MSQPSLKIAAVGDLQLGDSPTCVGFGFASRYGPRELPWVLGGVAPALAEADLGFANLETPLSTRDLRHESWSSRQLRGHPAFAPVLRAAGFTVLNVANNHAAQHGIGAFEDTVAALRGAGIAVCGLRGNGPWTSSPITCSVRDRRVGVVGYCLRPRQYGEGEPPYAEGAPEAIRADVARLRARTDAVIVSLHWGEEFVPLPSEGESALARSLVDAGASVVLGHHPHVVRPVEAYRDGIIAYSLGNCVGDMVWYAPFREGAILTATLDGSVALGGAVQQTRLGSDYRPGLTGVSVPVVSSAHVRSLGAAAYARAASATWRRQRLAVYAYTALRLWRFPPRLLAQLAVRTLRNKLGALARLGSTARGSWPPAST